MGVYGQRSDHGWRLHGVTPYESGLVVLPRALREADLPRLERWFKEQINKCIRYPRARPWFTGDSCPVPPC